MTVTIGTDTEGFLFNPEENKYVSVEGLIGGTKENPLPVLSGALQEDNVMPEFNIDPCGARSQFDSSISLVINQLRRHMNKHDLQVHFIPSVFFDEDLLKTPQASIFGCDPDFNVWKMKTNMPVNKLMAENLRTAGGHIHFGSPEAVDPSVKVEIARCMDYLLGLPSVLLDEDNTRRRLYGKAGAFRSKPYGGEYRVLSNFWVNTPHYRRWVFDATFLAVTKYDRLNRKMQSKVNPEDVIEAINTGDRETAQNIVDYLEIYVP